MASKRSKEDAEGGVGKSGRTMRRSQRIKQKRQKVNAISGYITPKARWSAPVNLNKNNNNSQKQCTKPRNPNPSFMLSYTGAEDDSLVTIEYDDDAHRNFRSKELTTSSELPLYTDSQYKNNLSTRGILVDWMVELHHKWRLLPQTLYLGVNIVDRYLKMKECMKGDLQLVAFTSILIASKYEENIKILPLVDAFSDLFSNKEVLIMEKEILKALQYRLSVPTPYMFLAFYLKADKADKKLVNLSSYVLEGALLHYKLLEYLPSQLAAASIFIARASTAGFHEQAWSSALIKYTQYVKIDIKSVAEDILEQIKLESVDTMYRRKKYGGVANVVLGI